ncbi:MAG TPA: hypothetical protein VF559_12730 [Caulobacteraceae bacterium]|jgi:Ca2+-binding RTX toxin-like protein
MAVVHFNTAVDLGNYDYSAWFGASPTVHTADQFVYVKNGQTVTFDGHDFTYQPFLGGTVLVPNGGFITDIDGVIDGSQVFSIDGIDGVGGTGASVTAIRNAAISGDDDAITNEFFGGNDAFYGSDGNDSLYGFGGRDKMRGGKGADTLNGGADVDRLYGGKGGDTFHFDSITDTSKSKPDYIMDLENIDKIDLTDMGVLSLSGIKASYIADRDVTRFTIDTDGDRKADAAIFAAGDHTDYTIDASHFLI